MPIVNSLADLIRHGDGLLEAGERSPEVREAIEPEWQTLSKSVGEVKTLKARQEELNGLRQEVTQKLREAVAQMKDAAIRYRAVVKAKFGPRSERLVQFNMAPLRKRPRKPVIVEVVKPAEPVA